MLKEKLRKAEANMYSININLQSILSTDQQSDAKNWNLPAINESLKEIFNFQPITSFRRNKNLKELMGSNENEKNKGKKKTNAEIKTRQMLSMPDKFKVTLLQASTKNN